MKRLLIIGISFFLSACATSGDVQQLQNDVNDAKMGVYETKAAIKDLRAKVQNYDETLDAIKKSQADMLSRVDSLNSDVERLNGRLDEESHHIERSFKGINTGKDVLNSRLTALEAKVNDLQNRLSIIEAAQKEKAAEEAKKQNDPQYIYNSAMDAFNADKTKEARDRFKKILQGFPQSEYAPNAQFWIGDKHRQGCPQFKAHSA